MDFVDISWILVPMFLVFNVVTIASEPTCPQVKLPNGSAQLKSKGRLINFRCKKKFELVGVQFAVCLDPGKWSKPVPTCVGTTCQKPAEQPNMNVESLYKGGVLKYSCKDGLTRSGPETIMCDGRKWNHEPPKCIEMMALGCDFENVDICGWSHDNMDDFDWTRHKGDTPTVNTGPSVDHTTNSSDGYYLFMESSAPHKIGQKARIISPPYNPDKLRDMCLEFYYHMYGPSGDGEVGDLDVYIKPLNMKTSMLNAARNIFHRGGNQGNEWIRAEARIPQQTESFNIVFQATKLKSWTGDIAIDDVQLYKCSERTTTAPISSPPPKKTTRSAQITTKAQTKEPTTTPRLSAGTKRTASTTTSRMISSARTASTTETDNKIVKTTRNITPSTIPKTDLFSDSIALTRTFSSASNTASDDTGVKTSASSVTAYSSASTAEPTIYDDTAGQIKPSDNKSINASSSTDSDYQDVADDTKPLTGALDYIDLDSNTSLDTDDGLPSDHGSVRDSGSHSEAISFFPLIMGIAASVLVGVVVIVIMVWIWMRNNRQKQEKSQEDQLNIITDYVETNLCN